MQLKFEANQDFQLQAIEAITGLFAGQPRIEAELRFGEGHASFAAVANRLDLTEADMLANLHAVQQGNGIAPDPALVAIEEPIETAGGATDARFYNFSVEMETGTGKTYVYLRSALELSRQYGLRKYIVVVPSVAVREGVIKTLQITAAHFRALYNNAPYRYYAYDSANISQVRQFALSDSVEIMVMTLAAFNKASNVIHQTTDRLQGETPVHLVQTARPILILDEPQNMESEKSIAALAVLHPLVALRYSATHRNPYNIIYRLTPFEAYRQSLVKRIEVASVIKEGDIAQPYIRLEKTDSQKNTVRARLAVHKLLKSGAIKEQVITVKLSDSLEEKTGRKEYSGFEIDEINPGGQYVRFANNVEINVGQEVGADKDAIFEAQIRYTVEEHLRKQERLRSAGIKVLTLFFIDRVANYRDDGGPGLIRRLFDAAFDDLKVKFPNWQALDAGQVQGAYFAQRRTRGGDVILEDSKSGEADKDREAYNLIMRDKERLLSLDEPIAFIFSHSALREGWDNPNVFQICTLNQTTSEVKKRQEVGRGVRLPVDQTGERVRDEKINVLTVVANESYERFVSTLQGEIAFEYRAEIEARYGKSIADLSDDERARIEAEYGAGILPPKPANARKRSAAKLRKEFVLKPEFKELWEQIKHKTRYSVRIDSAKLIDDVVAELGRMEIRPPHVAIAKARVEVGREDVFEAMQVSAARSVRDIVGRYPLPNLVEIMADLMQHTTPPTRLTQRTLLEIIQRAPNPQTTIDNPHEFATAAVRIIKEKLADQLVQGLQYTRINEWYEMTQLEEEIPGWEEYLLPAERSVYDHVAFESEVERQFVNDLEHMQQVELYLKLPAWFTVKTPIGEYNPDWAIVWRDRDEHGEPTGKPLLYLVRETKSTTHLDDLRPDERRKIVAGERHFTGALGVSYKWVSSARELP